MCDEGHFLGLTVCEKQDAESRLQSASVYDCYVNDDDDDDDDGGGGDDDSNASSQFDDMMRNLGAVGLLEK